MLICAAVLSSAQGKEQEAREALREAIGHARRLDAAPIPRADLVKKFTKRMNSACKHLQNGRKLGTICAGQTL